MINDNPFVSDMENLFTVSDFKICSMKAVGMLSQTINLPAVLTDREAVGRQGQDNVFLSFPHNGRKISVRIDRGGRMEIANLPSRMELSSICTHVRDIVRRRSACEKPNALQIKGHRTTVVKSSASLAFCMRDGIHFNLVALMQHLKTKFPHASIQYNPEQRPTLDVVDVLPNTNVSFLPTGLVCVQAATITENTRVFEQVVRCFVEFFSLSNTSPRYDQLASLSLYEEREIF